MTNTTYEKFVARVKEIKMLSSVEAVLGWDQETQMPSMGSQARADQLGLISGLVHDRLVSDEMGEWLDKLSDDDVIVREVRRNYLREKKIPTELVQEIAKTQSMALEAWKAARKDSDFGKFAPTLEKIVALKKKVAALIGGANAYDTLMDQYEPGTKSADIAPVFSALRKELVPLVAKIAASRHKPSPITGRFPVEKQKAFGVAVIKDMGFDFNAGRLDIAAHPFCSGFNPGDVRLTTRYDEKDFRQALFGTMHEAGHGLYEQGFEMKHAGTPLAEAVSMGIHESQSRLWENLVGRSRAFWTHYYPQLQNTFGDVFSRTSLDELYRAVNIVKPSMIRVEADEVTYNLHILLRFELEQLIFSGEASISALPALWNKKMEEYLGIRPANDAEGVLQDIHWSMGAFGYFPTYALGNLYAAQFFAKASQELGDLDKKISRGDLLPLREWLREKIHRHGMTYPAGELCRRVTGSTLDAGHFSRYLNAKFGELYAL